MFPRSQFRVPRAAYQSHRAGSEQRVQQDAGLPSPSASQRRIEDIDTDMIDHPCERDVLPQIRDVKLVASFNWKDTNDTASTILVPGQPPRWQPPPLAQSLQEDPGVYFRDINSACHPAFPIEPAVRAILHGDAKESLLSTDIFVCGSTLGCLLSVALNDERTFRFGVERVGSTTFLVRKTNTPLETIDGIRGYGHTFPEVYTLWEPAVKDSTSNQRIIQYDFMGLKIMIRSKCDGYLPHKMPLTNLCHLYTPSESILQDTNLDKTTLPAFQFGIGSHSNFSTQSKKVKIITAGRAFPQHAIFDLKTRANKFKDHTLNSLEDFYPRLWANQTPNLVLAFHVKGIFDNSNIHIKDLQDEIQDWEIRNSVVLQRLGSLLRKLIDVSKSQDTPRFEVRRTGTEPLEIWSETKGWSALPHDLKVELGGPQATFEKDCKDEDGDIEVKEEGGVNFRRDAMSEDEDEGDDADYLKF